MPRTCLCILSTLSLAMTTACGGDDNPSGGNTAGMNTGGNGTAGNGAGGMAGSTSTGGMAGMATAGMGGAPAASGCSAPTVMTSTLTSADTSIDDFSTPGDMGIMVPGMGSVSTFGASAPLMTPAPTLDDSSGSLSVMLTSVAEMSGFPGFVLTFANCVDATTMAGFTGVQFTLSGSVTGAGCTFGVQIIDSQHADPVNDPKGSTSGGYSGTLALMPMATPTTVMVPFTGAGAPPFMNFAANPQVEIDPTTLLGVGFSMPTVAANACTYDLTIDDVAFY